MALWAHLRRNSRARFLDHSSKPKQLVLAGAGPVSKVKVPFVVFRGKGTQPRPRKKEKAPRALEGSRRGGSHGRGDRRTSRVSSSGRGHPPGRPPFKPDPRQPRGSSIVMAADAVASWKAYVAAAAAADRGGYGDECALLVRRGLGDVVVAHFLESAEREFAAVHLPRLKALLENHGAASISRTLSTAAEKVGNKEGDDENEWSWVDEAVPRGVAELAAAVDERRTRAARLAAAMHPSDPDSRANAARALDRSLCAAVGAATTTLGPREMTGVCAAYYARALKEFSRRARRARGLGDDDDSEEDEDDRVVTNDDALEPIGRRRPMPAWHPSCEDVMGTRWSQTLASVASGLRAVGGGERGASDVAEAALHRALETAARTRVRDAAADDFEKKALPSLLRWLDATPLQFARCALGLDEAGTAEWRGRLEYAIYERLGSLRIDEFFNVIVEFPDSLPAVDDLRRCLRRTTLHDRLTSSLRGALQRRLLIPGAPTSDIIEQYRLTIRALRALDPSGVVLSVVSAPLKEYLRERKDTIRCVVTMLMGARDGADELLGADEDDAMDVGDGDGSGSAAAAPEEWEGDPEFEVDEDGRDGGAGRPDGGGGGGDGGADGVADGGTDGGVPRRRAATGRGWDAWEPEPVESEAASSRGRRRPVEDELGHLINIYGSKELFINEYRNMLAERLLSKVGYDVTREMHTLELLKIRFGEASLHKCEVMLKDVLDSKRINGNVKAPPAPGTPAARDTASTNILQDSPLDATIVSALFWPPFANEAPDFKLPAEMKNMIDAYSKRYHHLKAPRQLMWRPTLGMVEVEVMRGELELQLSVSTMEAAVLSHFQRKDRWGQDELAAEMGINRATLRRKAVVWINQGLLVEEKNEGDGSSYRLTTGDDGRAAFGAAAADDEGGGGGAVASAEDQAAAGMKVYEQYVVGMLTNFPSLPPDRIHNMLKMFVQDPPYDRSLEQLEAFLGQLVAEDKLALEGNQYSKR